MPQQAKHKQPSTQEHLDMAEIRDGITIMRDGSFRMTIFVSAINFALKSEQEQNALIYQYQNFINSLNFPIQISIQSRRTDLAPYLEKLKARLNQETNELIRIQTSDYIEFIKRMIELANIMDKKFFIIVPLYPPNLKKRGLFDKLMHPTLPLTVKISEREFASFKQELVERSNVIMNGLGSLGIRSTALNTQQVIELFYKTYNPEEATKERLVEIQNIDSAIVTKQKQDTDINKKKEVGSV